MRLAGRCHHHGCGHPHLVCGGARARSHWRWLPGALPVPRGRRWQVEGHGLLHVRHGNWQSRESHLVPHPAPRTTPQPEGSLGLFAF